MVSLHTRRHLINFLSQICAMLTVFFGLFWLGWILLTLLQYGIPGMSLSVFTQMTPPPGSQGGLLNAIAGSFFMVMLSTLIATPIGILAGTYMAEYGQTGWLSPVTRFINDILLSAPSIVIGLFVYEAYVVNVRHFSGLAGSFALGILVIPVVVRTTENMLKLVPNRLREAAAALGTPQWKIITMITLRASRAGIITGNSACGRPNQRRDRAPVVYLAQQSVLEQRFQPAHGESSRDDLRLCDEPLQGLAQPRMGRSLADYFRCSRFEHRCPSVFQAEQAQRLNRSR